MYDQMAVYMNKLLFIWTNGGLYDPMYVYMNECMFIRTNDCLYKHDKRMDVYMTLRDMTK